VTARQASAKTNRVSQAGRQPLRQDRFDNEAEGGDQRGNRQIDEPRPVHGKVGRRHDAVQDKIMPGLAGHEAAHHDRALGIIRVVEAAGEEDVARLRPLQGQRHEARHTNCTKNDRALTAKGNPFGGGLGEGRRHGRLRRPLVAHRGCGRVIASRSGDGWQRHARGNDLGFNAARGRHIGGGGEDHHQSCQNCRQLMAFHHHVDHAVIAQIFRTLETFG
jgi:hypothetical protein